MGIEVMNCATASQASQNSAIAAGTRPRHEYHGKVPDTIPYAGNFHKNCGDRSRGAEGKTITLGSRTAGHRHRQPRLSVRCRLDFGGVANCSAPAFLNLLLPRPHCRLVRFFFFTSASLPRQPRLPLACRSAHSASVPCRRSRPGTW
jgi:hypothetical protein